LAATVTRGYWAFARPRFYNPFVYQQPVGIRLRSAKEMLPRQPAPPAGNSRRLRIAIPSAAGAGLSATCRTTKIPDVVLRSHALLNKRSPRRRAGRVGFSDAKCRVLRQEFGRTRHRSSFAFSTLGVICRECRVFIRGERPDEIRSRKLVLSARSCRGCERPVPPRSRPYGLCRVAWPRVGPLPRLTCQAVRPRPSVADLSQQSRGFGF
jgi:hypothetical protein